MCGYAHALTWELWLGEGTGPLISHQAFVLAPIFIPAPLPGREGEEKI